MSEEKYSEYGPKIDIIEETQKRLEKQTKTKLEEIHKEMGLPPLEKPIKSDLVDYILDNLTPDIHIKIAVLPINRTTQLDNEEIQFTWFRQECRDLYGLEIVSEWSSHENKKRNSDADFTCKVIDIDILSTHPGVTKKYQTGEIVNLSLKTEGGNFTLANFGTQNSQFFNSLIPSEDERSRLNTQIINIKEIKEKTGKEYWDDCDNQESIKSQIKEIFCEFYYKFLETPQRKIGFYEFMNKRSSPLKLIGKNLKSIEGYSIPNNIIVEKIKNSSLRVGDFELRFKSESRKINRAWKINLQKF